MQDCRPKFSISFQNDNFCPFFTGFESDDSMGGNFSFESFYIKTLALHQIKLAQLQLRPPAWSQKQQMKSDSKSRKYTSEQIEILVKHYESSKYVPREEMARLSEKTGLTMLQVCISITFFIYFFFTFL